MAKTSINYLFPPQKINELQTWRFVLHFIAPTVLRERRTKEAISNLRATQFKSVTFPFGLDDLKHDEKSKTVAVPVEVTPDRRAQPNALADYESDVWKICGTMIAAGFGDLHYEAVDWKDEGSLVKPR